MVGQTVLLIQRLIMLPRRQLLLQILVELVIHSVLGHCHQFLLDLQETKAQQHLEQQINIEQLLIHTDQLYSSLRYILFTMSNLHMI